MRHAPGKFPVQAVVGSDSLYKYALPFRSNRLSSYFDLSSNVGKKGVVSVHSPNTIIFHAESAPACVCLLVSGNARLIFPSRGTVRMISRPAVLGELIGLSETIAQIAYAATLKADSECTCVSISRGDLIDILLRDGSLKEELLFSLSQGLNEALIVARKWM
jgi:CRP-like cAMP-binding protein